MGVLAVPAFFLWVLVHETWHALAAWIEGRRVLDFRPWPHFHQDQFYFGRVRTDPPPTSTISAIAPYCFDTFVLVSLAPGLFRAEEPYLWTVLCLLSLCALVDIGNALATVIRESYGDLVRVHTAYSTIFYFVLLVFSTVLTVAVTTRLITASVPHGGL